MQLGRKFYVRVYVCVLQTATQQPLITCMSVCMSVCFQVRESHTETPSSHHTHPIIFMHHVIMCFCSRVAEQYFKLFLRVLSIKQG